MLLLLFSVLAKRYTVSFYASYVTRTKPTYVKKRKMSEDVSMAEDPPERGVFWGPPVLPDRVILLVVIQRTDQAGVRRSVKMTLFMIPTQKLTREMGYERMKKTSASFFEQKEMEMTLAGWNDEG